MIEAHQLTKRYGEQTAVDALDFVVRPGTVTGFLGSNGAGKSTTMRMIVGLDAPTSGGVTVNGKRYLLHRAPLQVVGVFIAFPIGSNVLSDTRAAMTMGHAGVVRSLLGAGLYLALVGVLGVALGALLRSVAGGIAVLVGALMLVPGLVSLLPSSLPSGQAGTPDRPWPGALVPVAAGKRPAHCS